MRLINTTTYELHEFFDKEVEERPYAILSHRWRDGEVSYQDAKAGANRQGQGWRKIRMCCRIAQIQNLEWAWVDTCCIDKTSSAELSEAINSMYRWYEHAAVCFAFLDDVSGNDVLEHGQSHPSGPQPLSDTSSPHDVTDTRHDHRPQNQAAAEPPAKQFQDSTWFTRGWTLQELLAPKEVQFYDLNFRLFGTRGSLSARIADITGIDRQYLHKDISSIKDASIACRMSWASSRQTTRIEDLAYCLLGIFDVNMPLLYGEGPRAFRRLQEEIMTRSDDQSLFAWSSKSKDQSGLLASSPEDFVKCRYICHPKEEFLERRPFQRTNIGIAVQVSVIPLILWQKLGRAEPLDPIGSGGSGGITALCPLNCEDRSPGQPRLKLMIPLRADVSYSAPWVMPNWTSSVFGTFVRLRPDLLVTRKRIVLGEAFSSTGLGSMRTVDVEAYGFRGINPPGPGSVGKLAIVFSFCLPLMLCVIALMSASTWQLNPTTTTILLWGVFAFGYHIAVMKVTYCLWIIAIAPITLLYWGTAAQALYSVLFVGVLLSGAYFIWGKPWSWRSTHDRRPLSELARVA